MTQFENISSLRLKIIPVGQLGVGQSMADVRRNRRTHRNPLRRYLIIFQLGKSNRERLRTLAPHLQNVLRSLTNQSAEPAFRSITADIFGYMIESSVDARTISNRIESPDSGSPSGVGPPLESDDHVLIVEVGEDSRVGKGFRTVAAWLEQSEAR